MRETNTLADPRVGSADRNLSRGNWQIDYSAKQDAMHVKQDLLYFQELKVTVRLQSSGGQR